MAGESIGSLASFTCQACGAAVAIRASGLSLVAICSGCGSVSENENGIFKLVKKAHEQMTIVPRIALGTKGKLRGQIYQVIGFMRRFEEEYPDDPWDEYLLYNPFTGFFWLAESAGHWNLFRVTKSTPKINLINNLDFLGEKYEIFHKGNAVVQFVLGEFYWRVRVGDKIKTLDAICPPRMLSMEKADREIIWSIGEYLEPQVVDSVFHPQPMPIRQGVSPNQPPPFKNANGAWLICFLTIVALSLVQLIGKSFRPEVPIAGQRITVPATGVTDVEVAKFKTKSSSTHVTVKVTGSVPQTWANVSLRVVPEDPANTASYSFEKNLSFYSGVDDGEYWSEGDEQADFLINGLAPGDYRVFLSATPEPGHAVSISANVIVAPFVLSNLWLAIFLLILPPTYMSLRSRSFERNRWDNSEFDPFTENGES